MIHYPGMVLIPGSNKYMPEPKKNNGMLGIDDINLVYRDGEVRDFVPYDDWAVFSSFRTWCAVWAQSSIAMTGALESF